MPGHGSLSLSFMHATIGNNITSYMGPASHCSNRACDAWALDMYSSRVAFGVAVLPSSSSLPEQQARSQTLAI
jgi:hypothetical protein